jgi:chromosome segregation ATPase
MVTDPTEPELDLSWLEEMSAANEEEEMGAANLKTSNSSTQLEALLTLQAETRAKIATLQEETDQQLAMLANEITALNGSVKQLTQKTSSQWHELQADITSQTQAVQEFSALTQNFDDKFDYLLERISALPATLAADRSSQLISKRPGLQSGRRQQQSVLLPFSRRSIVLLLIAQSIIVASATAFLLSQFSPRDSTMQPPPPTAPL